MQNGKEYVLVPSDRVSEILYWTGSLTSIVCRCMVTSNVSEESGLPIESSELGPLSRSIEKVTVLEFGFSPIWSIMSKAFRPRVGFPLTAVTKSPCLRPALSEAEPAMGGAPTIMSFCAL